MKDALPVGRYALGLWTTNGWTSWGMERWREYITMDPCRGQGCLHMWSDLRQFSEEDLSWLGRTADVYRRHAACFQNARPIIGSAWNCEPYGYRCSDGERAFVVYNPTWTDQRVTVRLDEGIGLTATHRRAAYRHFPEPVRWADGSRDEWEHGDSVSWYLRPFELVLVKFTPAQSGPAIDGEWRQAPVPVDPLTPAAQNLSLEFEKVEASVTHVRDEIGPCE